MRRLKKIYYIPATLAFLVVFTSCKFSKESKDRQESVQEASCNSITFADGTVYNKSGDIFSVSDKPIKSIKVEEKLFNGEIIGYGKGGTDFIDASNIDSILHLSNDKKVISEIYTNYIESGSEPSAFKIKLNNDCEFYLKLSYNAELDIESVNNLKHKEVKITVYLVSVQVENSDFQRLFIKRIEE